MLFRSGDHRDLHCDRHSFLHDALPISARPRTLPRTAAHPAPPHSVLFTVVNHCAPPIRGRTTTSPPSRTCTPPLLVSIKGGGGLYLGGIDPSGTHLVPLKEHTRTSDSRYWHSPQSTPLAETRELPSLSRLACTPYYRHPWCKIVQCTCTTLLDVCPYGRNQDKPVRSCVTTCINHPG